MAFSSRYRKASHGEEFKNQNPARGRKHAMFKTVWASSYEFKNQNPARGRKPKILCYGSIYLYNLRTRTPQGDGNYFCRCPVAVTCNEFKNQNPARGRKPQSVALNDILSVKI